MIYIKPDENAVAKLETLCEQAALVRKAVDERLLEKPLPESCAILLEEIRDEWKSAQDLIWFMQTACSAIEKILDSQNADDVKGFLSRNLSMPLLLLASKSLLTEEIKDVLSEYGDVNVTIRDDYSDCYITAQIDGVMTVYFSANVNYKGLLLNVSVDSVEISEDLRDVEWFFKNRVFDTEYRLDSQGAYRSVMLLVNSTLAGDGPNIYVDTFSKTLIGNWGGSKVVMPVHFSLEKLDKFAAEMCEVVKK
jgi:hypothetical protein